MSHFFAYLSKMKFIQRWGLMRNTHPENIQEHSLQVAMIAHGLALIKNKIYNGQVNAQRTAVLALYHDVGEVITGDLPTPIKYFNPKVKTAYTQFYICNKCDKVYWAGSHVDEMDNYIKNLKSEINNES